MFVCGVEPSRTFATSRMNTVVPRTTLIGMASICVESLGARVDDDGVLVDADLRGPGGDDDVLQPERGVDVARREAPRVEALGVDVDHDLALLAAVRPGDLRALDGRDVGADEVVP